MNKCCTTMTVARFEEICDQITPERRAGIVLFLAGCCRECRRKYEKVCLRTMRVKKRDNAVHRFIDRTLQSFIGENGGRRTTC